MKALFDTNVILDLLLDRQPFVEEAQILFEMVESGKLGGYICATSVTTIDYLLKKSLTAKSSVRIIHDLLKLFEVAPIHRLVLEDALESGFSDFEDAVIHASAIHCGVQTIVTRDEKDYNNAKISVYSPKSLLNALSQLIA